MVETLMQFAAIAAFVVFMQRLFSPRADTDDVVIQPSTQSAELPTTDENDIPPDKWFRSIVGCVGIVLLSVGAVVIGENQVDTHLALGGAISLLLLLLAAFGNHRGNVDAIERRME